MPASESDSSPAVGTPEIDYGITPGLETALHGQGRRNRARKKRRHGRWLILGVVALIATLGGAALPYGLAVAGVGLPGLGGGGEVKVDHKPAFVPVGDVVVNLSEERLTRYLRVKLILVVDGSQEKNVKELFDKNKAILKNWLISHLSDKTLAEVQRGERRQPPAPRNPGPVQRHAVPGRLRKDSRRPL